MKYLLCFREYSILTNQTQLPCGFNLYYIIERLIRLVILSSINNKILLNLKTVLECLREPNIHHIYVFNILQLFMVFLLGIECLKVKTITLNL